MVLKRPREVRVYGPTADQIREGRRALAEKEEVGKRHRDRQLAVDTYQKDTAAIAEKTKHFLGNLVRMRRMIAAWKSKGFQAHGVPVKTFQEELDRALAGAERLLNKAKRSKSLMHATHDVSKGGRENK